MAGIPSYILDAAVESRWPNLFNSSVNLSRRTSQEHVDRQMRQALCCQSCSHQDCASLIRNAREAQFRQIATQSSFHFIFPHIISAVHVASCFGAHAKVSQVQCKFRSPFLRVVFQVESSSSQRVLQHVGPNSKDKLTWDTSLGCCMCSSSVCSFSFLPV